MSLKFLFFTIIFLANLSLVLGKTTNDSLFLKDINELYDDISAADSSNYINDSFENKSIDSSSYYIFQPFDIQKRIDEITIQPLDSLILQNNPLTIELVFKTLALQHNWVNQPDLMSMYFGSENSSLDNFTTKSVQNETVETIVSRLRNDALRAITLQAPQLFAFRYENLPDPEGVKNKLLIEKKIEKVQFVDDEKMSNSGEKQIFIKKVVVSPWKKKANSMLQFSQNSVTSNWYQGGSSNIAILGILTGQLNYDNKKNIQWDNNAEWRLGFNSVEGDTLRLLNTNDDILKINSKLGIKAGGNWFYSGSVDFSAQLFNNYKGVNSTIMKASFLTPVRLNIGVGLDYKYKKLFSLMLSPISYKYIYAKDIVNVSPKLFGIPEGKNILSQVGSSFKAQLSYSPMQAVQVDSKLSFYTNYEKVEIDWEIVGNFTVNRFFSTRLSLNPRYDNTVILATGEKAKLQFKELLSFGFAYKLLN